MTRRFVSQLTQHMIVVKMPIIISKQHNSYIVIFHVSGCALGLLLLSHSDLGLLISERIIETFICQ